MGPPSPSLPGTRHPFHYLEVKKKKWKCLSPAVQGMGLGRRQCRDRGQHAPAAAPRFTLPLSSHGAQPPPASMGVTLLCNGIQRGSSRGEMGSRRLIRNREPSPCSNLPTVSACWSLPLGVVPGSAHGSPGHRGEARRVLGSTWPGWLARPCQVDW